MIDKKIQELDARLTYQEGLSNQTQFYHFMLGICIIINSIGLFWLSHG